MGWLMRILGPCAWLAAYLPATAFAQPPAGVVTEPKVIVHFEAPPGVRLYELDPQKPRGSRLRPLCEPPCDRSIAPLGRTYFYDGAEIAKSNVFTLPSGYPDVTVHANTEGRAMRDAGVGCIVAGSLLLGAGVVSLAMWGYDYDTSSGPGLFYTGVVALPVGAVAMIVGFSVMYEGRSSATVRLGDERSGPSLGIGPRGPVLVF
jgi:hypothetical protein